MRNSSLYNENDSGMDKYKEQLDYGWK